MQNVIECVNTNGERFLEIPWRKQIYIGSLDHTYDPGLMELLEIRLISECIDSRIVFIVWRPRTSGTHTKKEGSRLFGFQDFFEVGDDCDFMMM